MALYRAASYEHPSFCSPPRKGENSEDVANTCAICLENMEEELAALVCGHVFHHTCVQQALARRPACPVCRRRASPQSAVRLYLSIGARAEGGCEHQSHSNRDGSIEATFCTSRKEPPRSASRLPERLREMRSELDRVYQIQRMTSSHSFRLENDLVRRRQQLEQTTRQMQHIQHELDRTNAKLKRWQRIGRVFAFCAGYPFIPLTFRCLSSSKLSATTSYSQSSEAKQAKVAFECKVLTTADRMLEKIRERQHTRCPSCASQCAEMKRVALEFATAVGVGPCCQRHGRHPATWNVDNRPPRHHRQDQSCHDV